MNQKIQRCSDCDEPTGRCEDDSIYIGEVGPLCEECAAGLEDQIAAESPPAAPEFGQWLSGTHQRKHP